MSTKPLLGKGLLVLFTLSGFAGLIYQSVWSHYLGLVLGHAAYAQSLVLAIYMGGMALGAWLVSRIGLRWRRLILAYALVEAVIGVVGLVFHAAFLGYTNLSQDVVLPAIGSDWVAMLWQWTSSALLIAPQSILLGMTFPLMSGGYLRIAPEQDGEILGGLYFTNSIGAAFGALVCTFVLLPWVGMPGAVVTAGIINLVVASGAALLARGIAPDVPAAAEAPATAAAAPAEDGLYRGLLLVAFATGATSFVYEIGWIRLLNQALGTTVHSFELMLSAFILGLSLGGLWVRRASARLRDPVAATGHAQVWMGIAAMLSLPAFAQSFQWVGWMMGALARNDAGYSLFSIGSATIALLVMFPAAFFAGMTLPLLTMALLRRGHGEASIGRVYAMNTLGAIVGVFVAFHVLIPAIGVRLSVTLAALVDLVIGVVLLRFVAATPRRVGTAFAAVVGAVVLGLSLGYGRLDPRAQSSGVFRTGNPIMDGKIFFLKDGKTATVSVFGLDTGLAVISTNGKPDAAIQMIPGQTASPDELTMSMAAALALAVPKTPPKRVAVIGWGSGLSTHTMLGSPQLASLDTIEIEHAMYEGARLFGPHVARAYADPRSHVHFDDARTYFSTGGRKFDVILSEPSNPWVSGVASLFTEQFYDFERRHLNPGGVLVQWIQSYELDDKLFTTMIAALTKVYPHVDVYLTNSADLLFVASADPLPPFDMRRLQVAPLDGELARVGLATPGDFQLRRIGDRAMLRTFVRATGATVHSDFYPTVSLQGPRTRFTSAKSTMLQDLVGSGMPVLDVLEGRRPPGVADRITLSPASSFSRSHWQARAMLVALRDGDNTLLDKQEAGLAAATRLLRETPAQLSGGNLSAWYSAVALVAENSIGWLPAEDLEGFWIHPAWAGDQAALPPGAHAVLAAFDAAARRDVHRFRPLALAALAQVGPGGDNALREQLLVLAMLGAIADKDPRAVQQLEVQQGSSIAPSILYGQIRSYLMAWADGMGSAAGD